MFTVLSNTRNSALFVIGAAAIVLLGLLLQPMLPVITAPRHAVIPVSGGQNAHDLFRQEELAIYNRPASSSIGSPAFYDYRRGEWSTGSMDAVGAFRQEELFLYKRSTGSYIGSPAFMEYRRGEWSGE